MTCDEAKKELALAILGLDAADKRADLDRHAATCPDCARRMEKARVARTSLAMKEPGTFPDWAAAWRMIEERSVPRRRFASIFAHRRHWAVAGATLVGVFILGAVIGRVFLSSPKPASPPDLFVGVNPEAAWLGYADRLELLLVDIGNRADIERPKELVKQEEALVGRILEETRALKRILSIEGDQARLSLLNDAEDILAKISAIKGKDRDSQANAAKIVRASSLKVRLQTF